MKEFCESLREPAMKIIDFKKKKMELLTNGQQNSYKNVKVCYIYIKKIEDKHCTAHIICNLTLKGIGETNLTSPCGVSKNGIPKGL